MTKPVFFANAKEFGAWLERHHATEREVLVGFHKTGTGRGTLTWPEAVDEALCHGWIDGVRKRIDEERYQVRFTPRKPGSAWSALNLRKMKALLEQGRVRPAGLAAWNARGGAAEYSYEQPEAPELTASEARRLRADAAAWKDWQARPPSYRKSVLRWLASAKQEPTRERRFEALLESSAAGLVVPPFRYGRGR